MNKNEELNINIDPNSIELNYRNYIGSLIQKSFSQPGNSLLNPISKFPFLNLITESPHRIATDFNDFILTLLSNSTDQGIWFDLSNISRYGHAPGTIDSVIPLSYVSKYVIKDIFQISFSEIDQGTTSSSSARDYYSLQYEEFATMPVPQGELGALELHPNYFTSPLSFFKPTHFRNIRGYSYFFQSKSLSESMAIENTLKDLNVPLSLTKALFNTASEQDVSDADFNKSILGYLRRKNDAVELFYSELSEAMKQDFPLDESIIKELFICAVQLHWCKSFGIPYQPSPSMLTIKEHILGLDHTNNGMFFFHFFSLAIKHSHISYLQKL